MRARVWCVLSVRADIRYGRVSFIGVRVNPSLGYKSSEDAMVPAGRRSRRDLPPSSETRTGVTVGRDDQPGAWSPSTIVVRVHPRTSNVVGPEGTSVPWGAGPGNAAVARTAGGSTGRDEQHAGRLGGAP